jgi:hypothetical protein
MEVGQRLRILYTGPLRPASLTLSRLNALRDLGHDVTPVDQVPYLDRGWRLATKLQIHLIMGPGIAAYNRDLVKVASAVSPQIIYVDTASYLWPSTVRHLRCTGALLTHYTSEHFGHMPHFYRHFSKVVPLYDVHLVTHPESITYLRQRGALNVVRVEFGYDESYHRPPRPTALDHARFGADAVFVGHWEPNTERMISALRAAGVQVRVWGSGWRKFSRLPDRRTIERIGREEYVKAIANAKISLCFLSKWNRANYSAGRTFEIPAIGGFLLAERTDDHRRYYEEGKEAEFFASEEELIDKARLYLANPEQRQAVARAGHLRCVTSGYRHQDRCRAIIESIYSVCEGGAYRTGEFGDQRLPPG